MKRLVCIFLGVLLSVLNLRAPHTAVQDSSRNMMSWISTVSLIHIGRTLVPISEEHVNVSRSKEIETHTLTLEVTAYNWTGYRCANGHYPIDGETIAINKLPFGTHVFIPGIGERIVEDRPDPYTQLDVYMGHRIKDALQFGRRKLKVVVED